MLLPMAGPSRTSVMICGHLETINLGLSWFINLLKVQFLINLINLINPTIKLSSSQSSILYHCKRCERDNFKILFCLSEFSGCC